MKNLKFSFAVVLLIFTTFTFSTCCLQAREITGNKELTKESRTLNPFEQINVTTDFTIVVSYAVTPKVEVEAESNLQSAILTEVKGKMLNISVEKRVKLINNLPITIYISLPAISKFQSSGNARISCEGIPAEKMEIQLSGNETVTFKNLKSTSLKLSASGAATINLEDMVAESSKCELNGTATLHLSNLSGVKKAEISTASTGICEFLNVSAETLKVTSSGTGKMLFSNFTGKDVSATLTGAGDIVMSGNSENVSVTNSGSGNYNAFALLTKKTKAVNSGSGEVSVAPESSIEITISGSGNVNYKGIPKIKIENTGTGQLVKK